MDRVSFGRDSERGLGGVRQTDSDTETKRDRQADRERDEHRDIHKETNIHTKTDGYRKRQANKADPETNGERETSETCREV